MQTNGPKYKNKPKYKKVLIYGPFFSLSLSVSYVF